VSEPHSPIGLVLDASAVLSYVRGKVHVGEVLIEVADNGAVAVLPVAALVTAWQEAVDRDRLQLLVDHPTTKVVSDAAHEWRTLSVLAEMLGATEPASAAILANDADCPVLTARPDLYAGLGNGNLTIEIPG